MRVVGAIILLGFSLHLQAQIKVTGVVQNQEKIPLTSINIIAYQLVSTDTLIADYTMSNSQGQFKLILATRDTFLIKPKALGYAESFLLVLPTDSLVKHTFTLSPQPIQLREVVVKSPPIRANSDTTTFKVKAFLDGTERNVEDLLKKLPGIKVDDNGKITAFGKSIDKVMIEGEDLFSKNYQIITKSLAAQTLEKVEVIDRYSENPLLKGIEKSNKVVLNLGVRSDLKVRPFGNGGGSVGHKNRYSANAVALTLLGKLKAGLVGNLNNMGENPVEASEYELAAEDDMKAFGSNKSNLLSSIPLTMVQVPNLEPRRVTFNRAALLGGTATYKINNSLKIKGFSYIYNDRLRLESGNKVQYFFEGDNVNFRDSSSQTRLPTLWANQLKIEYSLNPKTNFRYTFNHKQSIIQNNTFLDTQNNQLSEQVPTNGNDKIQGASHHLNSVRRLNDKNAIISDIVFTTNDLSRNNITKSGRYPSLFGVNSSFQTLEQTVNQRQQELKNSLMWKNANRLGNLSVGVGFLRNVDKIQTDINVSNKYEKVGVKNDFKNDLSYENNVWLLDVQESLGWKKIRFNVGGTAQLAQARLYNKWSSQQNFQESRFLVQPTLGVSAQISEHQRIMVFYYNQQNVPSSEQFTDGYIQSSYRSFSRNAASFYVAQNNNFQLTYNNTNWIKLYAINVGVSYNQNYFITASDFVFSDLVSFTIQQPIAAKLNQLMANWQIDRLIAPISTKIRLEGYASQSQVLNRVNGSDLLPNYAQNLDCKVYAISAFDSPFNFQINTRINLTQVINRTDKQQLSKTKLFVPGITLKYQPLKSLSIKLAGEQINWYNKDSKDITHLLDLDVIYHPEKSPWTLSMRGNNLLNTKMIYYTSITNYSVFESNYLLQPRWVSISGSYSF